ncbi:MAG TPA: FAD:protein FMN transferase, partial [Candidatus Dormibacteraeota bacterium]|nr:FAD:protein FMN transferase [Candidatus Dormibacteraeota bacterium]
VRPTPVTPMPNLYRQPSTRHMLKPRTTVGEAQTARRVRVEPLMGTVFSIDLRDGQVPESAVDEAFRWLHQVDRRFSPFRTDSEITQLGRGEITLAECHPDVATVLELCETLRLLSGGAFNAWQFRPDGRLDPSGMVKGWAVDEAARILELSGARNFCINAGGDVLARGRPVARKGWRVGIRNPFDRSTLAAVVEVTDMAVATSGGYERGDHIIDARSRTTNKDLSSLTVSGPSLTWADAYATTGVAMGLAGIPWVAAQPGYGSFGITSDSRVRYDEVFAGLLVQDGVDFRGAHLSYGWR